MAVKNEELEELKIEDLFSYNRLPSSTWKLLFIFFYFPFGSVLLLLRTFLGLHAFIVSCILRKSSAMRCVVLRILCTFLGMIIVEDGEQTSPKTSVVIANHMSPLDHAVLDLVQPCILPSVWDLPSFLSWCFGYADLGARQGRQTLINRARQFCSESSIPLLAFPEGATTSGSKGLLKFNSWAFDLGYSVQPVIIKISRPPLIDIAVTRLGSRWWTDLLWFLFVPYSIFKIRWLKPVKARDGENCEEFARRVERIVAAAAKLRCTSFTSHDAVEFAKRRLLDEERERKEAFLNSRKQKWNSLSSAQLDSMAFKVKETFPQVPLHVIRKDLERTGAVDLTASNIIENRLPFVPEAAPAVASQTNPDPSSWKSLYDHRKWQMIEENRKKYLARKGASI